MNLDKEVELIQKIWGKIPSAQAKKEEIKEKILFCREFLILSLLKFERCLFIKDIRKKLGISSCNLVISEFSGDVLGKVLYGLESKKLIKISSRAFYYRGYPITITESGKKFLTGNKNNFHNILLEFNINTDLFEKLIELLKI